ncbi:hypothetical protein GJ496_006341 [Pomphorhynchus laevis]|nr:hypothetical protein GJ496_006341 [Pomphorhynchus laevis]
MGCRLEEARELLSLSAHSQMLTLTVCHGFNPTPVHKNLLRLDNCGIDSYSRRNSQSSNCPDNPDLSNSIPIRFIDSETTTGLSSSMDKEYVNTLSQPSAVVNNKSNVNYKKQFFERRHDDVESSGNRTKGNRFMFITDDELKMLKECETAQKIISSSQGNVSRIDQITDISELSAIEFEAVQAQSILSQFTTTSDDND